MDCNMVSNGKILDIKLSGKCTFSDYKSFQNIADRIKDESITSIAINVARLEYIDSSGLGMFLMLKDKSEESSGNINIIAPTGQVKKMLEVARLNQIFNILE